jgi:Rrf2 family protein
MKLSTRSRYGTRLVLDLAQRYEQGPIRLCDIARRQNISIKYLEHLIRPLKQAEYVMSVRGPKGGHYLVKPPEKIRVGDIAALLEEGIELTKCTADPQICRRSDDGATRFVWQEATRAMYRRLSQITISDLMKMACDIQIKAETIK